MKAKVIATGEMVEVNSTELYDYAIHSYLFKNIETGKLYFPQELEFIDEHKQHNIIAKHIDWEQRRFELIKEMSVEVFNYPIERHERKMEDAIKLADAIIKKLKEGKNEQ